MIREKIIENVGIIYLDRPEIINSLNMEMVKDIEKILCRRRFKSNLLRLPFKW